MSNNIKNSFETIILSMLILMFMMKKCPLTIGPTSILVVISNTIHFTIWLFHIDMENHHF
jgi:hypothetical protein